MYRTNWGGGITTATRDLRLTRGQVLRQHTVTGLPQPVTLSHNPWGGPIRVTVAGRDRTTAHSLGAAITWCRDNLAAQDAA